ncbi:hypothetical protein Tco_0494113, partial [Tanacetum coccineum]
MHMVTIGLDVLQLLMVHHTQPGIGRTGGGTTECLVEDGKCTWVAVPKKAKPDAIFFIQKPVEITVFLFHLAVTEAGQHGIATATVIAKKRLGDVDLGSSNKAAAEADCNIVGGPLYVMHDKVQTCSVPSHKAIYQSSSPIPTSLVSKGHRISDHTGNSIANAGQSASLIHTSFPMCAASGYSMPQKQRCFEEWGAFKGIQKQMSSASKATASKNRTLYVGDI